MTRRALIRVALIAGVVVLPTGAAQAETLREAIATAYATNPTLAEARARQEALEERPEQARAQGRPTLSASANGGYDDLGYGNAGSADLRAAMPIWTGGRVSSSVRAASYDVAAGEQGLRDSEAAMLERVVAAYADLLFAQEAVEVARIGIERLDRQVDEAQFRFDTGEATRTDVAQLEASWPTSRMPKRHWRARGRDTARWWGKSRQSLRPTCRRRRFCPPISPPPGPPQKRPIRACSNGSASPKPPKQGSTVLVPKERRASTSPGPTDAGCARAAATFVATIARRAWA